MNEENGAEPPGRDAIEPPGFLARLADSRWLLVVLAGLLVLAALAGHLTAWAGAIVFVVMIGFVAFLSRSTDPAPKRLALRLPPPVWPDTGTKQMADALPEPCIILDRRGAVRYANRLAEAAFPVRPGDPLTFRMRAPDFVAAFERVAAGGPSERVEFLERVPTERWYSAWFAPLDRHEEDKRAGFIVLIFSDMTERRRAEKIRVDFVANASHELRTPLASLAGFIETLQGPARDDVVARERFLGIMHEQATRMSRLIDDLLSLSRIEMKVHVRPEQPIDLVAILRSVADAMEPLAREQSVVIETDLPAEPLIIAGDRDELFQVFQNLVENACKYGRSGGRVAIEVRPPAEGRNPAVTVRDFGPGIPSEHLPRLTERFYRADIQASRAQRGTGLGLAIVKHILNRHRARLAIESRPGQGAAFTVEFTAPPPKEVKKPL